MIFTSRWFPLILTVISFTCFARANDAVTGNISYTPRLDLWESEPQAIARTLYLRSSLDLRYAQMGLRADGFVTQEFSEASKPSQERRGTKSISDLSELFWDGAIQNEESAWALRIGRQPIRWSQSWTLPSLDFFTGRRANRLFLEPLLDQLTHPDAAKLTYFAKFGEIEIARVFGRSPTTMPQPFANTDRTDLRDIGLRVLLKANGFDWTMVARNNETRTDLGLLANYAFDDFVAKSEIGSSSAGDRFLMFGSDWFLETVTIGPQLTLIETSSRMEGQLYIPIRYKFQQWTVELEHLQYLGSTELTKDQYSSIRLGYDIFDGGQISLGTQTYRGTSGRPLGISESLTNGTVYGLRFEYTGGFIL